MCSPGSVHSVQTRKPGACVAEPQQHPKMKANVETTQMLLPSKRPLQCIRAHFETMLMLLPSKRPLQCIRAHFETMLMLLPSIEQLHCIRAHCLHIGRHRAQVDLGWCL